MITRDATDLILAANRFMVKNGADLESRREFAKAINDAVGAGDMLDAIYVNNVDNYLIPDVAVIHLYNKAFSTFLLNSDTTETCPFGYTIEIHERCFKKYTAEELVAVILHDILQNVQSESAKVRFLRAYTSVSYKHDVSKMLDLFDDISLSEVVFMMFTEICLRPFRVPVMGYDYVSTDEVLKVMGLGDAYDSYLDKALPMGIATPEDAMSKELDNDYRDVNTILNACLDKDIRHYYSVIRDANPLVTLENILGSRQAVASLGFVSRKKDFKIKKREGDTEDKSVTLSESFNNPKNDLEIRFQIDKIISSMRYAETESERDVILFRIMELSKKLITMRDKLEARSVKDQRTTDRITFLKNCLDELEQLRQKTVTMEIKKKRWSVYVKDAMPAGYDF